YNPYKERSANRFDHAIAKLHPGLLPYEVARMLLAENTDETPHPIAKPAVVSLGLNLEEPASNQPLRAGMALSLTCGIRTAAAGFIQSAMVLLTEEGASMLWPASNRRGYP